MTSCKTHVEVGMLILSYLSITLASGGHTREKLKTTHTPFVCNDSSYSLVRDSHPIKCDFMYICQIKIFTGYLSNLPNLMILLYSVTVFDCVEYICNVYVTIVHSAKCNTCV